MKDRQQRETIILERRYIPKGSMVMREGDDGYHAYLLQSGLVQVYQQQDGQKKILGEVAAGEIFGEMALFNMGKRTASVEALEDCNLVLITRQSLEDKLHRSDSTIRAIVNMMMRRLSHGNDVLANRAVMVDDFEHILNSLYDSMRDSLPQSKKDSFTGDVRPLIDQLVAQLGRYKKDTSQG